MSGRERDAVSMPRGRGSILVVAFAAALPGPSAATREPTELVAKVVPGVASADSQATAPSGDGSARIGA